MKQDMQSDNGNMYDLIAYVQDQGSYSNTNICFSRFNSTLTDAPICVDPQFIPHPHAGGKWCIYPSYDYAHCIVDSLENITH